MQGVRRAVAALLLCLAPAVAAGQARAASPVDDVLDRMTGDINDLRFADALRRGQPFAGSLEALPLAQRVRWRLLMAAAYYPFEREHQRPDSAMLHLRALVRIAPDARYAPEMRWRGLDSLLENARERTLAAVVRGPLTQRVAGPTTPGRVDVVATRAVRTRIVVVERATGRITQSDTVTDPRPTPRLIAHDDRQVLLAPGEYDLVLTAWDVTASDDSVTSRYGLTVEAGSARLPALRPEPPLPASALLPERAVPSRRRYLAKGIAYTALTVAAATLVRSDATLRDEFATDGRAFAVGGVMLAGVGVMFWREKERPIPANIAANVATRAEHERRIADLVAENRIRLSGYAVTVRIAPEPR
jgi:hypothetical protein